MKKPILIAVLVLVCIVALTALLLGRSNAQYELVLYGAVDIRQIELPFADSERIAAVLVEEGDRVSAGQVLARLDTGRLAPRAAQAEARVAAQAEALRRLQNGARPEEIAQARAALEAAQAEAVNARSQYERLAAISESSNGRAVSRQDLDAAQAALRMGEARVENARKALDLVLAGPREEDIAQAKAQLEAARAEFALLSKQLQDADLVAPTEAVVRSRLMEPGEFATPQRPVLSLAVTNPKWVRAYASETALGRLQLGMPARVIVDSFPEEPLPGSLGYISSVAEFTPKTVQTEELRTSLVYEVRVFVEDPQDRLRLGMPATVRIDLSEGERSAQARR
ncbi:MAG TPA: HlyD family efflux transporter periplasmic adaptor subunit [Steroidobacter sp.]|jgi:HlyD family secretion protein|nr:HlyD family efflux transporter periplasmic adaptor subunit [Steroidobacteraceae bacterium]HLS80075.1 HlyD family efflux transporter periplasmic adaptor subunit [Steroidobacter sp.]